LGGGLEGGEVVGGGLVVGLEVGVGSLQGGEGVLECAVLAGELAEVGVVFWFSGSFEGIGWGGAVVVRGEVVVEGLELASVLVDQGLEILDAFLLLGVEEVLGVVGDFFAVKRLQLLTQVFDFFHGQSFLSLEAGLGTVVIPTTAGFELLDFGATSTAFFFQTRDCAIPFQELRFNDTHIVSERRGLHTFSDKRPGKILR